MMRSFPELRLMSAGLWKYCCRLSHSPTGTGMVKWIMKFCTGVLGEIGCERELGMLAHERPVCMASPEGRGFVAKDVPAILEGSGRFLAPSNYLRFFFLDFNSLFLAGDSGGGWLGSYGLGIIIRTGKTARFKPQQGFLFCSVPLRPEPGWLLLSWKWMWGPLTR